MIPAKSIAEARRHALFLFIMLEMLGAALCLFPETALSGSPDSDQTWSSLLKRNPFPYRIPLSLEETSPIDGTYTRTTPLKEAHIPCRRCADWRPEGGTWKIHFSRGVFRIMYLETGWKDMGSYYIAKDRIIFANDPVCHDEIGVYRWIKEGDRLRFEVIDDECAIRLRAANLTWESFIACAPPNREAAISTHWPMPEGCE